MASLLSRILMIGAVTSVCALSAQAAERTPFENVKGWEIERTVGDTSANPCLMSHSYKDKDDDDAENAVVFALDGSKVILVLGYENWSWDKDEKVKVPLLIGKKTINAKSSWIGDGTILKGTFPDSLVPDLLAGKTILLKFNDGEADFEIAGFPQAYESLRRCDIAGSRAPAAPAPGPSAAAPPAPAAPQVAATPAPAVPAPAAAPAPAQPSQAQIDYYAFAVILDKVMSECDVTTTGKQRKAFETKLTPLKSEMAAVDAEMRAAIAAKSGSVCPKPGKEAQFQDTLTAFLDDTPEAFMAFTKSREEASANSDAAAGAKKPVDAKQP